MLEFKTDSFLVIDVGAKGILENLPGIEKKQLSWIGFEPQKEETLATSAKNVRYFSEPLNDQIGAFDLYIANHPSFSSLLKPDFESFEKHCGLMPNFQNWKEVITTKQSIKVNCTTLDQFCNEHNINEIDFLKIDTQGTELRILRGSQNLLANKAIKMIKTEFTQVQVYQGQCLISDIDIFLKSHHYKLIEYRVNLESIAWNSTSQKAPDKIRLGNGGDAFYVIDEQFLTKAEMYKTGILLASKGFFSEAKFYLIKSGIENSVLNKTLNHFYLAQPSPNLFSKLKIAIKIAASIVGLR